MRSDSFPGIAYTQKLNHMEEQQNEIAAEVAAGKWIFYDETRSSSGRGRAEEARYVAAWYQNAQWQIEMRVPLPQQGLL